MKLEDKKKVEVGSILKRIGGRFGSLKPDDIVIVTELLSGGEIKCDIGGDSIYDLCFFEFSDEFSKKIEIKKEEIINNYSIC